MSINRFQVFNLLQVQVFRAFVCDETFGVEFVLDRLVLGSIFVFVQPGDRSLAIVVVFLLACRRDGTHLRIDKGVSQQELFACIGSILVGQFIPFA